MPGIPAPTQSNPLPSLPVSSPPQPWWATHFSGLSDGLDPSKTYNWSASSPTFPSSGGMRINLSADGAQYPAPGAQAQSENQRCEVEPLPEKHWQEGQAGFFRLDLELLPGFPTQVDTWQLLMQWHGNDGQSPPVSLQVWQGLFILQFHGQNSRPSGWKSLGPATIGKHSVVVGLKFSRDPAQSLVSAKLDGKEILPTQQAPSPTLNNDFNYLKIGLYRDIAIRQATSILYSLAAIGPSVASVEGVQ